MSRDQLTRRVRRACERLGEPSSAAGLAALLALIAPDLAEEAPAVVETALILLTAGAALVAIMRGEGNGTNGR